MPEVPRQLRKRKPLRRLPDGRFTRSFIKFMREWDKADEIPPCRHCGRLVLAGGCCKKAQEEGR